jgi:hypothetical protein
MCFYVVWEHWSASEKSLGANKFDNNDIVISR